MRIGVNTLFLIPGEVGGTETVLRNLLPALQSLDPALELVLFTNRENHETFGGFDRIRLDVCARSRPRRIIAEQTTLVRVARRAALDVLFSPGYTAPLVSPCPQVVQIHDAQFMAFPGDFSWLSRLAHRFLIGRAAHTSRIIVTVSEFARQQISALLGVDESRIVVAPNGVSDDFFAPHPCARGKPFLLCVANTYPHKNVAGLTRAFGLIADKIPHDLVVVGQPGKGEPAPHPRVMRIHRMSLPELIGLYQACALFVLPSEYEGFGLPVLEAMAAGARVVASHAGAIPEVGEDAATYFDPLDEEGMADAILRVVNEPAEQRRAYVEAGRKRAKQFTWRRCADHVLRALRQACSG